MAIDWGAWEYSGGNGMRVGVDVSVAPGAGGPVVNTTSYVVFSVDYWTENQHTYGDTQTLNLGGSIGGSITFTNNDGATAQKRGTRTYTYSYDSNDYGSSPGNRTFSATLSGAYNGVTPSSSHTTAIPARPYDNPDPVTAATLSRVSDETNKVSWVNHDTNGKPYTKVYVDRFIYDYGTYPGQPWTTVSTAAGTAISYSDAGAIPNRKWEYRIKPWNSAGYSASYDFTNVLWTSPAVPTALTLDPVFSDWVVGWTNNTYYSEYVTEIWHAADGVWDLTALGTRPAGPPNSLTSFQHVGAASGVRHKYRLRTKTSTGTVLYSAWSAETPETAGTSTAPNAPTNLSPSGSTVFDPTQPIVFTWQYNTTDGSVQTSFSVRHRVVGSPTWTTVPQVTGTPGTDHTYTLPAASYGNDQSVEWQVMTWGSSTTGSAWSASAVFVTQPVVPKKYPMYLDITSGRMVADSAPVTVPYAARYLAVGQSVPNTTFTVIKWDTDISPAVGITYNAGTGEFTVPDDGVYVVTASLGFVSNATGSQRVISLYLNGASVQQVSGTPGGGTAIPVVTVAVALSCTAGDKLSIYGWQNSGAPLSTVGGAIYMRVSIVKMVPGAPGSGGGGGGSGGAPSGAAGGDLAGSYPNPVLKAGSVTADKVATGVLNYTFTQAVAAATWVIDHPLPYRPNVAVVDSTGRRVEGDLVYTDADTVTVTFSAAFAGSAYLS